MAADRKRWPLIYQACDGACLGERDAVLVPSRELIELPGRQHFRKILALVCAAAFAARNRSRCYRARHKQHVPQIEPFEPT